ncbi:phage major capsid protein [Kineosporia babensis]|uniref:Uncharacterized protein n=1 Tax=Kineosporia babensis TaxID=499548 RepID=A0A9X1NBR5_9ACTN|nr:hypothetical protein [Kineosporia babensis]MCD5310804.1 hypothetical protein [Kineosporia babensis]
MPYPAAPPTLAGEIITINRALKNPTVVQKQIETIADQQMVGEKLLTGRVTAQGGTVLYGVDTSMDLDRGPRAVSAGAEYPRALPKEDVDAIVSTTKYGEDVPLTDEKISREQWAGVNQQMALSVNTTVSFVDSVILSVVSAAVTQTHAATAQWSNAATANTFRDVMLAVAKIRNQGGKTARYNPSVLLTDFISAAYLTSDQKIVQNMPRESGNNIIQSGYFGRLGGLDIWGVPEDSMPAGVDALVADPKQLGFIANEDIQSPEYQGAYTGIQSYVRRDPKANDQYLIRTRRVFAAAVNNPSAAIKITGTK